MAVIAGDRLGEKNVHMVYASVIVVSRAQEVLEYTVVGDILNVRKSEELS